MKIVTEGAKYLRPKGKYGRRGGKRDYTEKNMASNIDKLAEFEAFQKDFLPALRQDLKNGMTSEKILKKYEAVAAARIAMSVTSKKEDTALRAAIELQNRVSGKPIERQEITHKYESLSEEEILSKIKSLEREVDVTPTPALPKGIEE